MALFTAAATSSPPALTASLPRRARLRSVRSLSAASAPAARPPAAAVTARTGPAARSRFAPSSTAVLKRWFLSHLRCPYPTPAQRRRLAAQAAGLTQAAVSTWFVNARMRLWRRWVEEAQAERPQRPAQQHTESGVELRQSRQRGQRERRRRRRRRQEAGSRRQARQQAADSGCDDESGSAAEVQAVVASPAVAASAAAVSSSRAALSWQQPGVAQQPGAQQPDAGPPQPQPEPAFTATLSLASCFPLSALRLPLETEAEAQGMELRRTWTRQELDSALGRTH